MSYLLATSEDKDSERNECVVIFSSIKNIIMLHLLGYLVKIFIINVFQIIQYHVYNIN